MSQWTWKPLGKGFLQGSQKYCHQVADILIGLEPSVQWPTWSRVRDHKNQRINKQYLMGKQTDTPKSTRNCWVFISLQEMVFLLVSVHFNIVSLTDSTTPWRSKSCKKFCRFLFIWFMKSLMHSFTNLATHPKTRNNLTLAFFLLLLNIICIKINYIATI